MRVLPCGADRLRALLAEAGLSPADGTPDVVLADPAGLDDAAAHGAPIVLVVDELTAEIAARAHAIGARVCLHGHGPGPLRDALAHGAGEGAARRDASLRVLVNTSVADVVFTLRVEGERFRFLEINPMFTRATGLNEAMVLGKFVDEVIPEPSLTMVLGKYRDAMAGRHTVRWEEVTAYPSGTKHGEVSVSPVIEPSGRVTHLVGTVHDVTEAREHEVAARALAAAEQHVLERAAEGAGLDETLRALALAIEAQAPPARAAVLLANADGKRLTGLAAPEELEGLPIADETWGARGRAWLAPIVTSEGRVVGGFGLCFDAPRAPTAEEHDLLSRACHVAGIVIQRHDLDAQLRSLTARIEDAREEERTGIAREIHDQLGQTITALKLELAGLARKVSGPLQDKVRTLSAMTDEILSQIRRISSELRPGILDDLGLVAAMTWQTQQFEQRTHITSVFRAEGVARPIGRELSTTVYRVAQEALTNVVRHADATRVELSLAESEGSLVLDIRDDGKGIGVEHIHDPRSLGLLGISERARRLGGTATFARGEPRGTVVTLRLPL